ncbi:hypothetical protein [Christensenella hongkongensis]|uniref:hypothetical protein n=1 Tax=Christensenella hongkongensis TaxID=270498 RepID=UPI00267355E7|nr:hypothetical protein [Christensenella hongkongensis]
MDEKILDYMTKAEYASEHPGVVKNAEHADSATGSQFADNAIKLGGNESTYYASAATMNEVLKTANGAQSTATAAQTLASEAKLDAAAAKSTADNAQATANACIPKSDITEVTGEFTTKVMSQKATTEQLNFCMKKADYDSDGDGVVERADEAIRAESAALADNALKLNGKTETELSVGNAEKFANHDASYYATKTEADSKMPKAGGEFTGGITVPAPFTMLQTPSRFVIRFGLLGEWNGFILDNSNQANQIVNATNHIVHNTYPLVGNMFDCGNSNYPWKNVSSYNFQNMCGSVDKKQEYEVKEKQIQEIIELLSQLPLRVYRRYQMEDGKRVLSDELELGVFIDDIKDHPLFGLIGRVQKNEKGEPVYSLNQMAWTTAAHIRAEYAVQKTKDLENKNEILRNQVETLEKRLQILESCK